MKHLFSCLKQYRKEAVLAPLFKLLEASMELVVPLIVAFIVDRGIAGGDRGFIVNMCLVLIGFGVVGLMFALIAQFFAARAAVGVGSALRAKLFHKLQSFSYTRIDEMGTSTMITRMTSDVNQVQTGVNMALRLFLRSPLIVFGAMAMAFYVDVKVALVFVAVIPLLSIVIFWVMAVCIPLYQKVQGRLDDVYLSTRENLAGVRVIRAFSLEEHEEEVFTRRNRELCRAQKKTGLVAALTNPLTFVIINLAVIALLYFGAIRVDGGDLAQGQVIALYGYLSQILIELIKLANLIVTLTKSVSCQKRIGKVLNEEGEPDLLMAMQNAAELPPLKDAATEEAVRFTNVSFAYAGGGENALTDISFSAKRGETIGILGGTGSGKSTLVNLIPRFYAAGEGEISVFGRDVKSIPVEQLRSIIALVPQKAALFSGTIRSNLLWGKKDATEEELFRAITIAQAEDVVQAKGGLDSEISQEGKNLSGGQRQRLTIARALVRKPEILILDDSSSALDYATDAKLRASIKGVEATVFLVSQRASTLMNADKIIVLSDGKIADVGTHKELLERCALYGEIYRTQVKEDA